MGGSDGADSSGGAVGSGLAVEGLVSAAPVFVQDRGAGAWDDFAEVVPDGLAPAFCGGGKSRPAGGCIGYTWMFTCFS